MAANGKLYGFRPGQIVWIRGQSSGVYHRGLVAPLGRQEAYQAKPSWRPDTVIVMRSATGVIGKPIAVSDLLADGQSVRDFIEALEADKQAEGAVRTLCAREGLILGGKLCRQTPQWQAYEAARAQRSAAEEALRGQIMSAKPRH
jgi:hypothetical protein